jgi:hypothetical protein
VYDAGDLIDYTITFSHTAGSQGTAYDAVLTDTLPIDPFGSGSLILTPTVLSVTDSAGTLTTADFTLTGSNATSWTLSNPTPVDVAPGRVVMITVRGTLSNAAMPGAGDYEHCLPALGIARRNPRTALDAQHRLDRAHRR